MNETIHISSVAAATAKRRSITLSAFVFFHLFIAKLHKRNLSMKRARFIYAHLRCSHLRHRQLSLVARNTYTEHTHTHALTIRPLPNAYEIHVCSLAFFFSYFCCFRGITIGLPMRSCDCVCAGANTT